YGPFALDEAKTRLDWSITDEEVGPNYLPEGVVSGRVSHTVRSENPRGLYMWVATLDAEFEVARGKPPESAWPAFFALAQQRIRCTQAAMVSDFKVGDKATKGVVIPLSVQLEEPDVFGRPVSRFSLSYSILQPFSNILKASALWTPTDTSWDRWSASLGDTAF